MFELEDHHWWFQSRLLMIEGLMRRHVLPGFAPAQPRLLDLGCGTGLFLQRRAADCLGAGADFSAEALHFCAERGVHRVVRADATRLPFPDASFDVVTAFDLIEHVLDHRLLVDEVWRVLRPGGMFLASVPAHPLLWSGHDESLHHRRRYTRAAFEQLFESRRWATVRMTSAFTLVFPIAAAVRVCRRLFSPAAAAEADTHPTAEWLNRLLVNLHRVEARWLEHHDLPVGISLMTIRRRLE